MKRRYSISKALSNRHETCDKEVKLSEMEIDNGQSQKWRLDKATQIREISNHTPTEQKKMQDKYRKKMNHGKCATHNDSQQRHKKKK
jgi:hypothetical protein